MQSRPPFFCVRWAFDLKNENYKNSFVFAKKQRKKYINFSLLMNDSFFIGRKLRETYLLKGRYKVIFKKMNWFNVARINP